MAYISRAPPSHLNMEMSFPFHGSNCKNDAMVERMEAVMRSLSFSDEMKPALKFLIESSVSFNGRGIDSFQLETSISRKTSTSRPDTSSQPKSLGFSPLKRSFESTTVGVDSPKHHAALKLQKVYKSFRTRRQLADCAVLVEQRWWKLLDFAMLKLSSVSFFDIERTESAISRWSRARTRAAKVGKGLSKNEKAQKLALQHWLEAIDPRHRYGHNLHFYYDCWLQCESMEPFFYWLDVGQGKEVNLEEQCSRSKLQEQCIKYLGPKEREAYEVVIEDGKFMYKQSRQPLDTTGDPTDSKWIFVLSTSRNLYIAQKKKGKFQHSSFLAGGATSAAGQLVIENGVLKAVWPHSGHYRPTEDNFQEFMIFLMENNVDLADVKKSSKGEEDVQLCNGLRHCPSEADLAERGMPQTKADLSYNFNGETCCRTASTKDTPFEVVSNACSLAHLKLEGKEKATASIEASKSSIQRYVFRKNNLLTEEQGVNKQPFVPSELILRRINSKKGIESYQLGKQLSFKWTTGAGPRIGCVRDYPSELQFQALEEVSLSPTSAGMSRFASPRTARCQNPAPLQTSMEQQQQRQQQPQKPDCKDRRRNLSL